MLVGLLDLTSFSEKKKVRGGGGGGGGWGGEGGNCSASLPQILCELMLNSLKRLFSKLSRF